VELEPLLLRLIDAEIELRLELGRIAPVASTASSSSR